MSRTYVSSGITVRDACENCLLFVRLSGGVGECHLLPTVVQKTADDFCGYFSRSDSYAATVRALRVAAGQL